MVFHEMYGCYYRAVAKILSAAQDGTLTRDGMKRIADTTAFSESFLEIIPALCEGKWQLLTPEMRTPLRHAPGTPLTELEKRWLKSVTLDPRFRLFGEAPAWLADVVPLFTPEDYLVFDRYADGDPYTEEGYIARFQTILRAIREKKPLAIRYVSGKGVRKSVVCHPEKLEFSEKDDKFRLRLRGGRASAVNLQRMVSCQITDRPAAPEETWADPPEQSLTFLLTDERNTLERAMMHFAHFRREAEKLDATHYRVRIRYDEQDQTELLIRILSFGPTIRVTEPDSFVQLIKERLQKQMDCGLKL